MIIDLHTHSTASDGSLCPEELIKHAASAKIKRIALTDHDGIDGILEAQKTAASYDLQLIPGIELSVSWKQQTIHIVGLNIECDSGQLLEGINQLQNYRKKRAEAISIQLEKANISNALEGARKFSKGNMLGRMHFARFLVDSGYAKDIKQVFSRYLIKNKPGHVKGEWASLKSAVSWIKSAGGYAVLAHPARYKMKIKQLKLLIEEFKSLGGSGLEVVSGGQCHSEIAKLKNLCLQYDLYASCGSDFHSPEMSWNALGKFPDLPKECKPVWELF